MPDFTFVTMSQCKSLSFSLTEVGGYAQTFGGERSWPHCTCPSYKYRTNGVTNFGGHMVPNPCKHIKEAQGLICGWHQQVSDETQVEEGVCPRCGGPTEYVRVAV